MVAMRRGGIDKSVHPRDGSVASLREECGKAVFGGVLRLYDIHHLPRDDERSKVVREEAVFVRIALACLDVRGTKRRALLDDEVVSVAERPRDVDLRSGLYARVVGGRVPVARQVPHARKPHGIDGRHGRERDPAAEHEIARGGESQLRRRRQRINGTREHVVLRRVVHDGRQSGKRPFAGDRDERGIRRERDRRRYERVADREAGRSGIADHATVPALRHRAVRPVGRLAQTSAFAADPHESGVAHDAEDGFSIV